MVGLVLDRWLLSLSMRAGPSFPKKDRMARVYGRGPVPVKGAGCSDFVKKGNDPFVIITNPNVGQRKIFGQINQKWD